MKSLLDIKKEAMTYFLILSISLSCLALFISIRANSETETNPSSQFTNLEQPKSSEEKRFDMIERCYDKTMRSISPSAERAIQVRKHCSEVYKNSPEDIQTIK